MLRSEEPVQVSSPRLSMRRLSVSEAVLRGDASDAYGRYLLLCSDYLKRQMMIYEHWPQRRYDVLGYREEKVFTDMNS